MYIDTILYSLILACNIQFMPFSLSLAHSLALALSLHPTSTSVHLHIHFDDFFPMNSLSTVPSLHCTFLSVLGLWSRRTMGLCCTMETIKL